MKELIERLEQATEGGLTLDKAILAELGFTWRGMDYWHHDNKTMWKGSTHFTSSIDAALTLVPEGWSVDLTRHRGNVGNYARVYHDGMHGEPSFMVHKNGPLALRICIAALKAREALASPPLGKGEA